MGPIGIVAAAAGAGWGVAIGLGIALWVALSWRRWPPVQPVSSANLLPGGRREAM